LATVILVAWAIAFAFQLTRMNQGIYTIFQTMMAIFQGPALAVLMTGLLWKRATAAAALAGFLTGVLAAIFLYLTTWEGVLNFLGWQPLFQVQQPFLYFSVWAFLVAFGVVVSLSFLTRPDPLEKQAFVISRSSKKAGP
jgi:SSS family solute:Na+ symporter